MAGYRELIAWKVSDELAKRVYRCSAKFPQGELYVLTSQIRRAALSVVLNIVEGHSRNNRNEFRNFLRISLGSLAETEYLLGFAFEQGYLNEADFSACHEVCQKAGKIIWKLYQSQK